MKEVFEKLDKSMGLLCLNLRKYKKDSIEYRNILDTLYQQYQASITILNLYNNEEIYHFKYCNYNKIKLLLIENNYIEVSNKVKTLQKGL